MLKKSDTPLHTSLPSEATSNTSRLFFTVRHLLTTVIFILLKFCMALAALMDLYRTEVILPFPMRKDSHHICLNYPVGGLSSDLHPVIIAHRVKFSRSLGHLLCMFPTVNFEGQLLLTKISTIIDPSTPCVAWQRIISHVIPPEKVLYSLP